MINKIQNFFEELRNKFSLDRRFTVFDYSILKTQKIIRIKLKISDIKLKKVTKKLFDLYFNDIHHKLDLKIEILPLKLFSNKPYAISNSGFIPMYKIPGNSGEIINQILLGEICTVLDVSDDNEWILIKLQADGYLGWVSKRSLVFMSQKEIKKIIKMPHVIITKKKTEIYFSPDEKSNSMRSAYLGIKLPLFKRMDGWLSVILPDGSAGWISADEADIYKQAKHKNAKKILKTARMFLGTSYLWGGRTADGIDCSGFVKTVFNFNGYDLPRDSGLQIRIGTDQGKDFNDFLPGDLLFFGPNEKKTTHVAIFTGEGMNFIHSSGYVKFNSLDCESSMFDERLSKLFKGARRII